MTMKRFFCNGKKDFCDVTILCADCGFANNTGGRYVESALKPCPFCGCEYTKDEEDSWYAGNHADWCPLNAEFRGGNGNLLVLDDPQDIAAWNRMEYRG